MLRALRQARFVQFALAAASLLAITGSLGLHPEPAVAGGAMRQVSSASFQANRAAEGDSHACLACLAHRTVPLPGPAGVLLAPIASVSRPLSPRPTDVLSTVALPHDGRAPPCPV
jgi:hypothetical protein